MNFLDLIEMENAALVRIHRLERQGQRTAAADEMSAVTMRRLEVARLNRWTPVQREIGRAGRIGGFNR